MVSTLNRKLGSLDEYCTWSQNYDSAPQRRCIDVWQGEQIVNVIIAKLYDELVLRFRVTSSLARTHTQRYLYLRLWFTRWLRYTADGDLNLQFYLRSQWPR